MTVELVNDILNAAGPRRDAVMVVLINHGVIEPVGTANDTESTGPEAESEPAESAVAATAEEEQVSTEATESES